MESYRVGNLIQVLCYLNCDQLNLPDQPEKKLSPEYTSLHSGLVSEGLPNKCSQHYDNFLFAKLKGEWAAPSADRIYSKNGWPEFKERKRSNCSPGAQLCCNTTCHTTFWMANVSMNQRVIWMVEHETMWWALLSIQKSPWNINSLYWKLLEADTMFKGFITICLICITHPLKISLEDRPLNYTCLCSALELCAESTGKSLDFIIIIVQVVSLIPGTASCYPYPQVQSSNFFLLNFV